MPPAVALAAPAVLGAGASASGGKKARKQAQQAADRQFQFQQQLFNKSQQAWQPATNYFSSLLSGDPTRMAEAVGPTSDLLKQQGQSQAAQLAATSPAGGQANLAQTQNSMNTYNNMARLYAGVQPQAAQALGQLSGLPMQLSAPNVGSGLKFDTHQQEQLGQAKGSLGSGLGQVIARGKTGVVGATPPFNPGNSYVPGFSQVPTEGYT